MSRHGNVANRFEEEKNIQSDHHQGPSPMADQAGENESSDEQGYARRARPGAGNGAMADGDEDEQEPFSEEIDDDELDEEQRMLDQRVPQIVNQFFEQNSDQRFNYLQGLKQLLTKQLEKKFEDAKNSLLPEEAQMKKSECNDEDDDDQDMLMNLPPQLIELVLQFIFKIYSDEFEDKKNQCETDSEKNNLKTEDVFDEYDRQAIDDLRDFINWYSQYKAQMTDELNHIQAQLQQNVSIEELRQHNIDRMNF